MVALLGRGRTYRRCARIASADAGALVEDLQSTTRPPPRRAPHAIVGQRARYLPALSRRLKRTCSNSTASSHSERQAGVERRARRGGPPESCWRAAARCRRSRRCPGARGSAHGAGLQPRHVEEVGDEAVEPLGLLDDGRQELGFAASSRRRRSRAGVRPRRGSRQRRPQVVRDRGQQGRAQAVGLGARSAWSRSSTRSDPLDGERGLVGERVEEAPPLGRKDRPGPVAVDADHADRPRPVRIGRNRRLAPGSVSAPRPAGRSLSKAHCAAARSASSSLSSGG